jgi:hypothetical protein
MLKLLAAALAALFVTASPVTFAQVQSPAPTGPERLNPTDLAKLTDARPDEILARGGKRYPYTGTEPASPHRKDCGDCR